MPNNMYTSNEPNIGMRCIKYLLSLSCLLFVITALLIISVGTTIYAVYNDFDDFLEKKYFSPASLLIAIGIIILLVSLFGFVGTLKESSCLIMMFAFLLGLILILELAAAIAAFAMPGGIHGVIDTRLNESMNHYNVDKEEAAAVDFLQDTLNCCGCNGPNDWTNLNLTIPNSCYAVNLKNQTRILRTTGCTFKLTQLVYQSSIMIGIGALSVALVQVLGMTFAFMLGKSIRQAKTERELSRWQLKNELINGNTNNAYMQFSPGDVKVPVTYTASDEKQI